MDDAIVFLWQTNVSNGGLSLSIGRLKWCFSDASVYGSGNYGWNRAGKWFSWCLELEEVFINLWKWYRRLRD